MAHVPFFPFSHQARALPLTMLQVCAAAEDARAMATSTTARERAIVAGRKANKT